MKANVLAALSAALVAYANPVDIEARKVISSKLDSSVSTSPVAEPTTVQSSPTGPWTVGPEPTTFTSPGGEPATIQSTSSGPWTVGPEPTTFTSPGASPTTGGVWTSSLGGCPVHTVTVTVYETPRPYTTVTRPEVFTSPLVSSGVFSSYLSEPTGPITSVNEPTGPVTFTTEPTGTVITSYLSQPNEPITIPATPSPTTIRPGQPTTFFSSAPVAVTSSAI